MPQDWIDAHAVDEDGLVTLTTDYPDVVPFSTYGRDRDTRRALRMEFLNRAWPANDALLTRALRDPRGSTRTSSATPTGPTTTPRSR